MALVAVGVNIGTAFQTSVDISRGKGTNPTKDTTAVAAAIATAAADSDVVASATAPAKVAAITTALNAIVLSQADDVVLVYDSTKLTSRNKVRAVLRALADALNGIGATNG
jgi:hypothetical protein